MRNLVQPLVDFNYWANRRLLGLVEGLPGEVFRQEVGSEFSFPTLQGMLLHIMGAEAIWLARWRGESPTELERADRYATVGALRTRWETVEREVRQIRRGAQ